MARTLLNDAESGMSVTEEVLSHLAPCRDFLTMHGSEPSK